MTTPTPSSQQQLRTEEFASGAGGGGRNVHAATAMPSTRMQQANPVFEPAASVLMASNSYSGVGLGSSDATMSVSNPYGKAMRDQIKQSGSGEIQQ